MPRKYETKNYNSNCSCGSGYSSYNNIFCDKRFTAGESLRKEIDEIQKEMVDFEQIDVDKISKKLKATVTTGDYAKIEKAIKNYMADNLNTMLTI